MPIHRLIKLFILLFIPVFTMVSQAREFDKNFPGQLSIEILQPPTPLVALNKYYLAYELHITNYQTMPITLMSLTVTGDDNQRFQFIGDELNKMISGIGIKTSDQDPRVLQSGIAKIILVWLPFKSLKQVPNLLTQEISFSLQNPIPYKNPIVKTEAMIVDKTLPIVISAPLHGDNWIASNGPSEFSEHRKENSVFNGHDYFAQRYAIDFIKVGENGFTYHDDKTKMTNYYSYGAPVYSVASGRVVQIKNGVPDNNFLMKGLFPPILRDFISGNYILIDVGGGKYAFYGHLLSGSLKVKIGSVVREGQWIAKVGNSGVSSEPHLHFQMIDKPDPFAANGIPYLFHSFYVKPARFSSDKNNEIQVQFLSNKPQKYIDQLALENTMVSLPGYMSS